MTDTAKKNWVDIAKIASPLLSAVIIVYHAGTWVGTVNETIKSFDQRITTNATDILQIRQDMDKTSNLDVMAHDAIMTRINTVDRKVENHITLAQRR